MIYAIPIIPPTRIALPGSMRASGGAAKADERKARKLECQREAKLMLCVYRGLVDEQRDYEMVAEIHMPLRNARGYRLKIDPHNHMPALIDAVAAGLKIDDRAFLHTVCKGVHDTEEYALVSVGRLG